MDGRPSPVDVSALRAWINPPGEVVARTDSLAQAIAVVDRQTLGIALVRDGENFNQIVGVITSGDIVRALAQEHPLETTVGALPLSPLVTLPETAMVDREALERVMGENPGAPVAVINDQQEVIGWLSRERIRDFLASTKERPQGDHRSQREQIVNHIAQRIRQSLHLDEILQTCVTELRQFLNGDRLLIYQFQSDYSGIIVAESVGEGIQSALGNRVDDTCFRAWQGRSTVRDQTIVANDIQAMGYTPCHLDLLGQYDVTANLVQPIYVDGNLWGLLIAHHCGGKRIWQAEEVAIFAPLSVQLAIAIQQASLVARLARSQVSYEQLTESIPIGIFRADLHGHCYYVNAHWSTITGLPKAHAQGNRWQIAIHPEDRETVFTAWDTLVRTQQPTELEYRYQRPDRSVVWVYCRVVVETDNQGQPTSFLGSLTDITDRKNLEDSLRHSQAQYEKAQHIAKIGHWELNLQTNHLYWSPEVYRIFELDPEQFGRTYEEFLQVVHPDDREALCHVYDQHLLTQAPYSLVHRLQMADGRIKYVREDCETTFDDQGKALVSIGTVQDITAEKRLEIEQAHKQRLQEELSVVETVLDDVLGGYWDWDMVTNEEYLSAGYRRMFGYEAEPSATDLTTFREIIFPEDWGKVEQSLARHVASQGQIPYSLEVRYRHKNGSTVWVLCAGKVVEWDDQGKPVRMVGGHIDITQQKENEFALRESQAFIQGITDASPDVLYVFDIETKRNIYINRKGEELFGYTPQEFQSIGDQFMEMLVHPDDVSQALDHFERLQRAQPGQVVENEYRMRIKSGQWRTFLSQDTVYKRDETGRVIQVVGVAQDITYRKQVEELLQRQAQQERLLSHLIERMRASLNLTEVLNTTVASLQTVLEADRVLVYRVLPSGTGMAIAEAVQEPWEALLDREFPEEVFPTQNYERYVQGRIFALFDREAQREMVLPCLAAFLTDIQVQAKLVVPIVQQDTLWGLLIAHQCGTPRNWQDWEIQLLRRVASQLAIAIQQADLYNQLQEELRERQGTQEQLSQRNQELAISNERLSRATRLKDEFLANMSHELRTPLNAILGLAEGLLEQVFGALTPQQKKSLETIQRSGHHLLSLINDILDVAKIEAGELELEWESVPVKSLCESSLVFVKQQAQKKQIRLLCDIPSQLPPLLGDERRLRQILINLLTNAVKFTPERGQVTLTVRLMSFPPISTDPLGGIERISLVRPAIIPDPSTRLEMAITDTGIGIAPEDLDRLFQPFVQIDSALNRKYEGTGLGLALVKQLVELHGGEVRVSSRLNWGSTFTLSLPVVGPEKSPYSPLTLPSGEDPIMSPTESNVSGMNARPIILLAEDNEANATTFISYLEAKGYQVLHATDGAQAIALLKDQMPDLVLMDIQMPVMDGLTAIKVIREELALTELPIIALTALAMEGDREVCLAAGANDYLSKPVKLKELVTRLGHYLNT